jgi:hypothetical protein
MKTRTMYRILKTLLRYAGRQDFTNELISAKKLGVSYEEWSYIMILLQKSGYIEGVVYTQTLSQRFPEIVDIERVGITISGIEYVEENSTMKKVGEMLKEVGEIL